MDVDELLDRPETFAGIEIENEAGLFSRGDPLGVELTGDAAAGDPQPRNRQLAIARVRDLDDLPARARPDHDGRSSNRRSTPSRRGRLCRCGHGEEQCRGHRGECRAMAMANAIWNCILAGSLTLHSRPGFLGRRSRISDQFPHTIFVRTERLDSSDDESPSSSRSHRQRRTRRSARVGELAPRGTNRGPRPASRCGESPPHGLFETQQIVNCRFARSLRVLDAETPPLRGSTQAGQISAGREAGLRDLGRSDRM